MYDFIVYKVPSSLISNFKSEVSQTVFYIKCIIVFIYTSDRLYLIKSGAHKVLVQKKKP